MNLQNQQYSLSVGLTESATDRNMMNLYAELEEMGRNSDGNAQVTSQPAVTTEPPQSAGNGGNAVTDIIEKVNNKEDIPINIAGRQVAMSATNWLLALIAGLLFLKLILD